MQERIGEYREYRRQDQERKRGQGSLPGAGSSADPYESIRVFQDREGRAGAKPESIAPYLPDLESGSGLSSFFREIRRGNRAKASLRRGDHQALWGAFFKIREVASVHKAQGRKGFL